MGQVIKWPPDHEDCVRQEHVVPSQRASSTCRSTCTKLATTKSGWRSGLENRRSSPSSRLSRATSRTCSLGHQGFQVPHEARVCSFPHQRANQRQGGCFGCRQLHWPEGEVPHRCTRGC